MDTCDSLEKDFNNLFPPGGIDAKLDVTLFFNVSNNFLIICYLRKTFIDNTIYREKRKLYPEIWKTKIIGILSFFINKIKIFFDNILKEYFNNDLSDCKILEVIKNKSMLNEFEFRKNEYN
jgi:hypothetical protein